MSREKRVIALFISFVMMFSCLPLGSVASETSQNSNALLEVESQYANPGSSVKISVSIKNNPGIAGAKIKITYDDKLEMLSAVSGETFAALDYIEPPELKSSCLFNWDSLDAEVKEDGELLNLTFAVASDAAPNDSLDIIVSYEDGDIYNKQMEDQSLEVVNGKITVLDYKPGDVNDDNTINGKDVTALRRYNAGYPISINETAADVNDDNTINGKDITLIRRFNAGYEGIELKPHTPRCNHSLEDVPYKAENCGSDGNIAYWYCLVCGMYFSDMNGKNEIAQADTIIPATGSHTVVIDPAVPPTYTSTGLTEGSHCSSCGKVLVQQQPIPILTKKEYSITYNIAGNDLYLQSLTIENPNPSLYCTGTELLLHDLSVDGYVFEGWYDETGKKVTKITDDATGNITLTAKWICNKYSVQFSVDMIDPSERGLLTINSDAVGTERNMYTSDKDWVLPKLTMDTYTFVGWSDQNGKFYSDNIIRKGTTGNLILKDNWVSQRNRAIAKTKIDDPLVVEDTDNQMIYFGYEIGKIENVPLYTTQELNCVNGIVSIVEKTVSHSISQEEMQSIGSTIAKETTNSTQTTLSRELTNITEVSEKYLEESGVDVETAKTQATSQSNTQSFSASSSSSSQDYIYNDKTTKNTKNNNFVVNENLETGINAELKTGIKNTTEASAGVSFPVEIVKVNAGVKNTTEISAEAGVKTYMDHSSGGTASWGSETYTENNSKNSHASEKSWNSSSSSSSALTASQSSTVAKAMHEMVSKEYGYGKTYSETMGQSELRGITSTSGETTNTTASLVYTEQTIESQTVALQTTGKTYGNYRMVMAGTIHVFAIVGYDIANKDYFVYTYNVMGDGTQNDGWHEIMDYSYDRSFNDHENTVIPFEIPAYVEDYVNSRITRTDGLEYDFNNQKHTAIVEAYTGTDSVVYVPSYVVDEVGVAYKVTGITSDAFRGNTNIKAVSLGRYTTSIPDSSFEDCTSLEHVICPEIVCIGNKAFSGCVSLKEFLISDQIELLGEKAFEDVPAIVVNVGHNENHPENTVELVTNAAASGAKEIQLNMKSVPRDMVIDLHVDDGEVFAVDGGDSENSNPFSNLTITSKACKTQISNISFTNCNKIPLKIYSTDVLLSKVDISNCKSYAILFGKDMTNLLLSGTNTMESLNDNVALCKNVDVSYKNSGKLKLTGNVLTAGTVTTKDRIIFEDHGEIIQIASDEFDVFEKGTITITFDPDQGTVEQTSKDAFLGVPIGELPTPSKDYHTFLGWFTASGNDGEQVTDETVFESPESLNGITLYAHWTLNELSEWVQPSQVPDEAEIINQKWSYTQRTYIESGNSNEVGWTRYDVRQSGWGATQGPIDFDPSNGSRNVWSEQYVSQVHYKTVYHYFRYSTGQFASGGSDKAGTGYGNNYYTYDFDYELTRPGSSGNNGQGYRYYYNAPNGNTVSGNYISVWKCSPFTSDEVSSYDYSTRWYYQEPVYTYYYFKDDTLEKNTYPSGDNISNVTEWVQYRMK